MFSKDIGIDLGTANTLVCLRGRGIILREPSVVAVDTRNDSVLAVGAQAKEMIGRTPESIMAVRPLRDGVIADFAVTARMIRHFIKCSVRPSLFSKPRVVICMPTGVTEVERRAVEDAAYRAGARAPVTLIEEPMAAAVGAVLAALSLLRNRVSIAGIKSGKTGGRGHFTRRHRDRLFGQGRRRPF